MYGGKLYVDRKTIILGVSGGIAAYKIPNLASMLVKQGQRFAC